MANSRAAAADVHTSAVIDPSAELGVDVVIGPYAVIGPNVMIGDGTHVGAHAVIERDTTIGEQCRIHAGAVLGGDPQDLKYAGEPSRLVIGARTVIREFATVNRGTAQRGITEVGCDCLLMAYAHVAHDCEIGDHVIIANSVALGGHVLIEDWAIVGGLAGIHQFARIGAHAFVGGVAAVRKDVPPFVITAGNPAKLYGLNTVGLQRRGFSESVRAALKRVYKLFFLSNLNVTQAVAAVRAEGVTHAEVAHFLEFIEKSERGITVH
jgi:UDP-N-acetylglucosamine acyltransferase